MESASVITCPECGTAKAEGFPLPTALAGTLVMVNGAPVPLLYASPTQINFQLPENVPVGIAQFQVVAAAASVGESGSNPFVGSCIQRPGKVSYLY